MILREQDLRYLVERAVRNARPCRDTEGPRWAAVRDVFCVGSTMAKELCRLNGLDPDQMVMGAVCRRDDGGGA